MLKKKKDNVLNIQFDKDACSKCDNENDCKMYYRLEIWRMCLDYGFRHGWKVILALAFFSVAGKG